jgi:uncharacterized membrane protein HdeD (DUF308 family)
VSDTRENPVPESLSHVADHWGLVLGFGVVTILFGLVPTPWPEPTLVVLAVLVGPAAGLSVVAGPRMRSLRTTSTQVATPQEA